MTLPISRSALALLAVLCLGACGDDSTTGNSGAAGPTDASGSTTAFLLKADLPEAVDVYSTRKKSVGDEVTVYGRVRDEVDGLGAFTIIDQSMPYCGQEVACGCTTPWDYCCDSDKIPDASLPVAVRDAKGDVVEISSGDVRLLDLIAIKGKLVKTESGGLMLVTNEGWYRRDRPKVADNVVWPE